MSMSGCVAPDQLLTAHRGAWVHLRRIDRPISSLWPGFAVTQPKVVPLANRVAVGPLVLGPTG